MNKDLIINYQAEIIQLYEDLVYFGFNSECCEGDEERIRQLKLMIEFEQEKQNEH